MMIKFIMNTIAFGVVAVVLLVGANEIGRRLQAGTIRLDDELRFTWNAMCELPSLFSGKRLTEQINGIKTVSLSAGHVVGLTQTNEAGIGPHKEVEVFKSADRNDSRVKVIVPSDGREFSHLITVVTATRGELKAGRR